MAGPRGVAKVGWVIALGGASIWVLAITRQVLVAFLFISIGGPAIHLLAKAADGLEQLGLWPPSPEHVIVSSVLALPALVLVAVRCRRAGGLPSALMVVMAWMLAILIATSYRLPALVVAGVFAWSARRPCGATKSRLVSWGLLLLAITLSLVPVDVSLRVRPHGPQCARAWNGCPAEPPEHVDAAGDTVYVADLLYNAPKCVWVW